MGGSQLGMNIGARVTRPACSRSAARDNVSVNKTDATAEVRPARAEIGKMQLQLPPTTTGAWCR